MNLRIGSATAYNRDIGFENPAKLCFDNELHAVDPRQFLPTPVIKPVIPDMKKVSQRNVFRKVTKLL